MLSAIIFALDRAEVRREDRKAFGEHRYHRLANDHRSSSLSEETTAAGVASARSLDRCMRVFYASRTFQHEAERSRNDS